MISHLLVAPKLFTQFCQGDETKKDGMSGYVELVGKWEINLKI
jgi:hypothetical protein